MSEFNKIDVKQLAGNTFEMYDDGWALCTAGTPESFNTMTISWGGLGWLWRRPVAFTFIRTDRYTHRFVEANDCYTLSFFAPGAFREQLRTLGSRSGRDMDKMGASGLTPLWLEGQPAFAEAEAVLVCRKLYSHQFQAQNLPAQVLETAYPGVDPAVLHVAYTAGITACYVRR